MAKHLNSSQESPEEVVTVAATEASINTNEVTDAADKTSRQAVRYVLWGLISVVVNFCAFYLLYRILHIEYQVANLAAWVTSVQVAFWVDRLIVFKHKSDQPFREMGKFYSTRVVTLLIESAILWLGISLLGFPGVIMKVFGHLIAVICNFFLSKIFVFRQ